MSHALPLPRDPASPDVVYVLRCWGEFDIIDRATGNSVRPRGRKARALIAYLASHAGGTASRTQLADLLWSDRSEEHARASLRQALVELRSLSHGDGRLLTVDREQVKLDRSRLAIDVDELAEKLSAGDLDTAERVFANRGIRLFAGLDGADREFDAWLAVERARQHERLRVLTCEAVKSRLGERDVKSARALIAHLQGQDPVDEEVAQLGLRADSLAGDHTTLRRRYKRLCDDLRRELGAEPSAETRALYQSLTANRPAQPVATSPDRPMPPASAQASTGQSITPVRARRWLWPAFAAAMLLVLFVAALIGLKRQSEMQPTAVAVLPFKDLSPHGGGHFAEGLSEELLSSLARTPGLKVMGRTSSWSLRNRQLDASALGRKLGVDYLVEGSVLASGPLVRVNVSLVRTGDGAQLWSERYESGLDDILTVQDEIAATVVERLRGDPVAPRAVRAVTTRGDAYSLYLTARGLMRTREAAKINAAVELLRRAVAIDPKFAPAWASLGAAMRLQMNKGSSAAHRAFEMGRAVRYVKHALSLDPELAEAHGALGMILGFASPEARAHVRRAAQLDPYSAENQYWLGVIYSLEGDFAGSLNAYRRGAAIDPLWERTTASAMTMAWQMGYRDEALSYLRRVEAAGDPYTVHLLSYEFAVVRGDFSAAVAHAHAAIAVGDTSSRYNAKSMLATVLRRLGYVDAAMRLDDSDEQYWRLWQGKLPSAEVLRERNAASDIVDFDVPFVEAAAAMLPDAGRSGELVALYDSGVGVLGSLRTTPRDHYVAVYDAPLVALALRDVGRGTDADRVLAKAEAAIRRSFRHGRVPNWFYSACAGVWAVRGERAAALSALERAIALGWTNSEEWSRADIGDISTFRSLRGDPRFERIRARFISETERERSEFERLPGDLTNVAPN